jgi:deoxyadenosine/deoxycytidine kinase
VKKFIAIAGNMGAGKSTMVEYLHHQYSFTPVYEPFMDNPYLDDFYKDMKRWSFHSQLYFLTHKFRLHMELLKELNGSNGTIVLDRSIYEDSEIFCRNLFLTKKINKRDFQTYMELYQTMKEALQPPDLMIYLKCSVGTIKKRIKKRGRDSEQSIPTTYIRNLNKLYEKWIKSYDLSPILIWETDRMDYISDIGYRIEFHQEIDRVLNS